MSDEQTATLPEISAELRDAARQAGGGWLDEVVGNHAHPVPVTAIKGAWKLDANGELTGEYVANPNFRRTRSGGGCPFHR
ncbi:MAG TPA: hypothetical protein VGO86_19435 [Candidatus Dormibacteraeota bacterium]|jgi:hypothetical protein